MPCPIAIVIRRHIRPASCQYFRAQTPKDQVRDHDSLLGRVVYVVLDGTFKAPPWLTPKRAVTPPRWSKRICPFTLPDTT
jgi:hypothetical protein